MQLGTPQKVPHAADLRRALQEARSIADAVGQPLTSAHILLALFTVPNPAEILLREREIDEDRILELLPKQPQERAGAVREAIQRCDQIALQCDARSSNTLHLLIGFLKTRDCLAAELLEKAMGPTGPFRNKVLSFVTGVLPRRLLQPIQDAKAMPESAPMPKPRPTLTAAQYNWVVPKETFIDNAPQNDEALPKNPSIADPYDDPYDRVGDSFIDDLMDDDEDLLAASGRPAYLDLDDKKESKRSQPHFHITTHPTTIPTEYDLDPDRFPWLTSLGRNLSALAGMGDLDPAIGRDREIVQLIDVLGKRRANNPCLVGEPGVGKTAIAEGLAVKLAAGDPQVAPLFGKVIIELDMGRIMAGTSLRGSFSERMQGLKKDVERAKGKIIVFIDEIHTLMGSGGSGDNPQDAAGELKASLARGAFPCIGSTTLDEYAKYIENDPALERRFVKVLIEEPSDDEAIAIMRGIAPLYERHHNLEVTDDAICASVQLATRFIHDRKLPGKSIDLLDLSMSRARRASDVKKVTRREVATVCADVAKVPLERILLDDTERFLEMERFLGKSVVGHNHVAKRIGETIRRNYAGFVADRPMGSFLFLGPTGVGKTEMAKALALFLYGKEDAIVRIDMSEYSESHTVSRLIGSPPGYVGHKEGGQLTEAIRRRPHCVVLLDEIEKAHTDILPLLLQVLDEGRLTDSKGRTVTFRHCTVVMTSNLGVAAPKKQRSVGFATAPKSAQAKDSTSLSSKEQKRLSEEKLQNAKKHFSPELWGRIEEKLIFEALDKEQMRKIAHLLLEKSQKNLELTRNIIFTWNEAVLDCLINQAGEDEGSGARFMRQAVQRLVESPLAEAILRHEVKEGDRVALRAKNGHILAKRVSA